MKRVVLLGAVALVAGPPVFGGAVWVEGEKPTEREVQRNGWYSSVKPELLSGEGALMHWGGSNGRAVYEVEVPERGTYALWLRANPVQATLEVRVGDGNWMVPDLKGGSRERINIAADNKPDLRFVAWVKAGVVEVPGGKTSVEVRFVSGNNHHGMLDCFCLTTDLQWAPQGTLKPGEKPPHWPVPELTAANLDDWITFIRPSAEELGWRAVRWHRSLSEAAAEARDLDRPILLWAMNGHPCGET